MSFMIAAAGTGGHVFPGLAVGEALLAEGVNRGDVLFVGGDRLEADVYPQSGYDFLQLDLRGLRRSLSLSNLGLPELVMRARNRIKASIVERNVRCVLGMGGYVTIPAALATPRRGNSTLMIAEQNAGAGLANRVASRWASRVFSSFPETAGLPQAEWVGNPVRSEIADFDRNKLRSIALDHYGIDEKTRTLGVFGGSLGAAAINDAIVGMLDGWRTSPIQVVHITGAANYEAIRAIDAPRGVKWIRKGFEDRMELFFAACDLVVARAGGAVAEVTATGSPAVLIPGDFGSSGHQAANAAYLERSGAAVIVAQAELDSLGATVSAMLGDQDQLEKMHGASLAIARPDAAKTIARAMIGAAQ